jgi:hypothetical protein
MSGINAEDLRMHEELDSEFLSEIRVGKSSAEYPMGLSFKPTKYGLLRCAARYSHGGIACGSCYRPRLAVPASISASD